MTKTVKPAKKTKAQLVRKVMELEANLSSTYHFADQTVHRAGSNLMASGVVLQLTNLGGKEIIPPVMIPNGLSDETIAAIRADIRRAYLYVTELKPKGLPEEIADGNNR